MKDYGHFCKQPPLPTPGLTHQPSQVPLTNRIVVFSSIYQHLWEKDKPPAEITYGTRVNEDGDLSKVTEQVTRTDT